MGAEGENKDGEGEKKEDKKKDKKDEKGKKADKGGNDDEEDDGTFKLPTSKFVETIIESMHEYKDWDNYVAKERQKEIDLQISRKSGQRSNSESPNCEGVETKTDGKDESNVLQE